MVIGLSALLTLAGVLGLVWTGRGGQRGPLLGLVIQPVWAAFAVVTHAWPLLGSCVLYGWAHAVNLRRARRS